MSKKHTPTHVDTLCPKLLFLFLFFFFNFFFQSLYPIKHSPATASIGPGPPLNIKNPISERECFYLCSIKTQLRTTRQQIDCLMLQTPRNGYKHLTHTIESWYVNWHIGIHVVKHGLMSLYTFASIYKGEL